MGKNHPLELYFFLIHQLISDKETLYLLCLLSKAITAGVTCVKPAEMQVFHEQRESVVCWQTYTAVFEAAVEGAAAPKTTQMMRPLTFDLVGEGHLPTVRVSAPTLRSRSGLPLLLFHRLLVGRAETLQLVLTNEGALQSQVDFRCCVYLTDLSHY